MLSKIQKIWLWIFGAMFLIPEILFFTSSSLMKSLNGESFSTISSVVINYGIFFDYPLYLLAIIIVEWLGAFGMTVLILKSNNKIFAIIPFIILLWLSYNFMIIYVTGFSMNLFL